MSCLRHRCSGTLLNKSSLSLSLSLSRDSAGLQSTAGQRWIPVTVGYGKIVINFSRGGRLSRSPFQHGTAAGIVLRQVQELGPPGIRRVCAQRKCTRVRGSAGRFIQRRPGGWLWSLISACGACTWVLRPLRGCRCDDVLVPRAAGIGHACYM